MVQVSIVVDTFLKQKNLSVDDLADSEKVAVTQGTKLEATSVAPDRNQHLLLSLATPVTAKDGKTQFQQAYVYAPHVKVEGDAATEEIKLPVGYCSQLDNDPTIFGPGWRQCNTTSNTMLANYLLKGALSQMAEKEGYPEPESVYMRIVVKYGDTTDHSAQTQALQELGIESYFSYTLSPADVLTSLRAGIPVVVGFAYKGSGHICIIVGYIAATQSWYVHDPYGTRHGASDSYDVGVGGEYDVYSNETMQQVFWDQGVGDSGWGRIVTSVKGTATGLPTGL